MHAFGPPIGNNIKKKRRQQTVDTGDEQTHFGGGFMFCWKLESPHGELILCMQAILFFVSNSRRVVKPQLRAVGSVGKFGNLVVDIIFNLSITK